MVVLEGLEVKLHDAPTFIEMWEFFRIENSKNIISENLNIHNLVYEKYTDQISMKLCRRIKQAERSISPLDAIEIWWTEDWFQCTFRFWSFFSKHLDRTLRFTGSISHLAAIRFSSAIACPVYLLCLIVRPVISACCQVDAPTSLPLIWIVVRSKGVFMPRSK